MTSPKWLNRIACLLVLACLIALPSTSIAEDKPNETRIPGKQLMVAKYTNTPPLIDGVFSPREWRRAIPVHVVGSTPETAPGVVPNIGLPFLFPPDSPADSSFTMYTLYDDNNLYVAVDVTDDIVICDGPVPFLDDDVEVMVDGDRRPADVHMALVCRPFNPDCPNPVVNNEGFKLTTSVCGETLVDPSNNPDIAWESKSGTRPHGFVIEFRISLDSINTNDTSWFSTFPEPGFRRPQPGDIIGFNVIVGDDDNGGLSYLRSEPAPHTDSGWAWDGRSIGWYVFSEQDWGNLYLAPTHL